MSKGNRSFQFHRLAVASMVAAALAGCSSDSSETQAPITAIGAGVGAPAAPAHRSTRSSPPVTTAKGKIIYNRNYGNIPKGSYNGRTYTVQHGDTLFYIAWITGNDYRDLAAKNSIAAPYSLSAGQVLQIDNGAGQPITGSNEITRADAEELNNNTEVKSQSSHISTVAQQPVITYSEYSGDGNNRSHDQSSRKLLPSKAPAGSASAPISAPAQQAPTVSSKASSPLPISLWHWPTSGKIIDNFSASEGGNKGIDIAGSRGQAVVSTAAGRVVYAGNALRGYGNLIIIKHNDDYLSAYAHNDKMLVREQQEVSAGQSIATMGSTGTSSVRLHFEIRYKGKSVNPLRYLPQR